MSTVLEQRCAPVAGPRRRAPSLLVLAALALLYVPTCISFAHGLWRDDEYAHAPIVLVVFAWLAWRERAALGTEPAAPSPLAGGALLVLGLALYAVGRSQSIALFEAASMLPVIAGLVLVMQGMRALRRFAFPLAFLAFSVPVPGFILAAASAPLKEFVSTIVALLLGALGYPVVRDGVVLDVGTHRLLLADACAGLNSLTALFAIVALYAHLTGGLMRRRAWLLLAAVVPIAVAANTVRVLALALIAYHYGEETAQGFVHGFAGMLVFAVALGLLLAIDRRPPPRQGAPSPLGEGGGEGDESRPSSRPSPKGEGGFVPSAWLSAIAAAAMAGVAFATPALRPVPAGSSIDLETMVPARFGGWRIDAAVEPVAPAADVQERVDRLYEQVLSRTYVNAAGEQMMLTIAYGGDQSDALKVHRQEVCYAAQGFTIHGLAHGRIDVAGRSVPVTRMLAVRGERSEPVTYWFTMGDRVVLGRLERLRTQLAAGLAGRIPDGMLVRVSSLATDAPAAFEAQRSFLDALVGAMPAADAARLAGARRG